MHTKRKIYNVLNIDYRGRLYAHKLINKRLQVHKTELDILFCRPCTLYSTVSTRPVYVRTECYVCKGNVKIKAKNVQIS